MTLDQLVLAASAALARAEFRTQHRIRREPLSVRERMTEVLERLDQQGELDFFYLLNPEEGRPGVVVTLLAVLDLIKCQLIQLVQENPFGPILIQMRTNSPARANVFADIREPD